MTGLCVDPEIVSFRLPGETMFVDFVAADGGVERRRMNLDTLLIEAAEPHVADWRVMLSWRVNFEPDRFRQARNVWGPVPDAKERGA